MVEGALVLTLGDDVSQVLVLFGEFEILAGSFLEQGAQLRPLLGGTLKLA